ncbi:MAG: hypothetical protein SA339_09420, partial [Methanomassiliicoccus sp.]|nr:hypothetical protein [Methanomassiliicoccus sp.]
FEPQGEDMWKNPMGFVVHFFSEDQLRQLSKRYELQWIKEFEEPSPAYVKRLYEVALLRPR